MSPEHVVLSDRNRIKPSAPGARRHEAPKTLRLMGLESGRAAAKGRAGDRLERGWTKGARFQTHGGAGLHSDCSS